MKKSFANKWLKATQSVKKNFRNVAYVKHAEVSGLGLKLSKHLKGGGLKVFVGN